MSRIHLSIVGAAALFCGTAASTLFSAIPAHAQAQPANAQVQLGKKVFDDNCAKCHGGSGKGDGPEARRLGFHPRDFTLGAFKCRCTPTGQPPSEADLMRSVTKGLPGTPMVPNDKLSEADRAAVIQYVKTLSTAFRAGNLPSCPARPPAPPRSPDLAAEGKALYERMQCAHCHGASGRGDGPSASTLKDDWGNAIKPYNFVLLKQFKCGNEDADLFRTLQTGMTGSPMPSFVEALAFGTETMSEEQKRETVDHRTWAVVQYLRTLAAQ